jgi:drug/metabolite transporter (DMT)-like permease
MVRYGESPSEAPTTRRGSSVPSLPAHDAAGPGAAILPPANPVSALRVARRDDPWRGILLILGAVFFFSCSDAASKFLTGTLPVLQVAWFRFVVFAIVMVPTAIASQGFAGLRARQPRLQILRAIGVLGSAVFFVVGLGTLPMAEATTMAFVSPIFVTALSIPFLGETVGLRRWAAVLVGLLGVMIVVRPGFGAFDSAAIYPILSALSWAVTLIITRKTADVDGAVTALAYAALVGFLALSAVVPFIWTPMGWREIMIGAATGIASTVAQGLIVLAYRHASASLLAPFFYSQLVWSVGLGILVFGDVPDAWTFAGAGVIVGSGLYTAHRERIRARPRTTDAS